jgi:2,4-dienoyl-CoA reductase-like NADH-dependent reductase (Old Yellow Enzyme family)
MELRNRFMRSATTSAWSDERSTVKPEIIKLYRELAKGGVGLIVKGHLHISDSGKGHIGMAGINHDYQVPKLKELTDGVHEHGGTIVAQLNHAGYKSIVDRAGPSEYQEQGWNARGLTVDEIGGVVDAFGEAAGRAMEAGFDGVQIHGAHGYLVSQFLSSHANRRDDDYGGDLKGRMNLLNEVYDSIRARVGDSIPVMLKLNSDDFSPGGFTVEESAVVAGAICKRGLDSIEISGGGVGRKQELRARARSGDPELAEADFAGHAEKIRKSTKPTPMALVHGIRSLRCMEAIMEKDLADLVSMSRPFIREPDLVKKLESGQQNVSCITCDLCHAPDHFSKMMLRCHVES